jgi:type IV pilus assembly protein PilB
VKLHRGKGATAVFETARPAETELPTDRPEIAAPARPGKLRIGEMLVAEGTITKDELTQGLLKQAGTGRRLGEVLVEMGALGERDFLQALSVQLEIPLVDLRSATPEPEALACIPEAMVREARVLPVSISDGALAIAFSTEPMDALLAQLAETAGMPIRPLLALSVEIERAVNRSYDALGGIDQFLTSFGDDDTAGSKVETALDLADGNAPVVQVVTRILTQAVRSRASDIHIEPQDTQVRVRFRVDGALLNAATLPVGIGQALVSRIKIMADMNIVERRRPQDGQLEVTVDGRGLDVRVATAATIWGEKAVLRLLDKSRSMLDVARLGMQPKTAEEFSSLIRSPFGMVIIAGPTGAGKTTTLYAALSEINDPSRNITTIEDPVEYVLPSINQIQINEQAGITFAGGLKSILRQDPDIILVGEIRDAETARIAVQSALTGHFVLSSLHATDATSALHRFIDMGIEPFLIASSVIGLVAQRLVRRICSACREPYQPSSDEVALYDRWGGAPKTEFWHGAGCNFCAHTGYSDRIGVYELLRISEEIRELVIKQASSDELEALAKYQGMRSLRDEGLSLIEQDVTTIAEILRTIYIA